MGLMMSEGKFVGRDEIALVPTPEATASWKPVPHSDVIDAVTEVVKAHNWQILEEQYGLARDGQRMFGVMRINRTSSTEWSRCIGIRNSHDRTLALGLSAGLSVRVCSNLMFGGSTILKRRHTSRIELNGLVLEAVNSLELEFLTLENVAEEFTNDFVDAFSAITGLSLRNKQSFYQNISQHIFFMISRVVNGQRFKNPILDKMRNEYRAMEKVCSIICWILAKKHGTSCINDDEISYLMLYIQGEIIDLEPKMNTLVIFDLQKSLQSLFQIQLSKRFPNLNVTFTDNDGGKNLPEYDLIINTKSMKNKLQEEIRLGTLLQNLQSLMMTCFSERYGQEKINCL